MEKTVERAKGRWRGVLSALGIPAAVLTGKQQACPLCGGTDRFQFTDRQRDGDYICRRCGAGKGLNLIMKFQGWNFREATMKIDEIVGGVPITPSAPLISDADAKRIKNRMWGSSYPVQHGDPVWKYLTARGLSRSAPCLRFAPRIQYRAEVSTWHPAMLAMVSDPSGRPSTIHRTFLTVDGGKADVEAPRRMMPGAVPKGSAVRLCVAESAMGIAEGIETALSAEELFKVPTWAALNAEMLRAWLPPDGTTKVTIFGDNDRNHVGQAAAHDLARRLSATCAVEVKIPDQSGADWNDILRGVSC